MKQWLANIDEIDRQHKESLRRHGASSCIAKAYRVHRLVVNLKRLLFWHHMELVMHVQRRFRGFRQRKKFRRLLADKKAREVKKRRAAVMIQATWRMHVAYLRYRVHCAKKQHDKMIRYEQKKMRLQQVRNKCGNSFTTIIISFLFFLTKRIV